MISSSNRLRRLKRGKLVVCPMRKHAQIVEEQLEFPLANSPVLESLLASPQSLHQELYSPSALAVHPEIRMHSKGHQDCQSRTEALLLRSRTNGKCLVLILFRVPNAFPTSPPILYGSFPRSHVQPLTSAK